MKQNFWVSVESTVEGYEVVVSGEDVGVSRSAAPNLDQALGMAAKFMQMCCEEKLSFP